MLARHGFVLISLMAAACSATPGDDARAALADAFASARASLAATGGSEILPAAALAGPATWRQPVQAGAAPPAQVRSMVGQPARSVRAMLGAPNLIRKEGAAEVWLYSGQTCRLDVMFYPEQGGSEPRVAFAAARATGLASVAETTCLRQIIGETTTFAAGPRIAGPHRDRF